MSNSHWNEALCINVFLWILFLLSLLNLRRNRYEKKRNKNVSEMRRGERR